MSINWRRRVSSGFPRRAIAAWLFVAGLTVFVWLPDMISVISSGTAPAILAHDTTEFTSILDPSVIAPTAFVACWLLIKRRPVAYLLAVILMIANGLDDATVISQTIFQTAAGIVLSLIQLVAFVGSFAMMGLFAVGLLVKYFRCIEE